MALKLRRGTEAERAVMSAGDPAAGEFLYITDTDDVYVGDGTTAGGVLVSGGTGDVVGPTAGADDGRIVAFDGTSGKLIKNTLVTPDDVASNTGHRGFANNPHTTTFTQVVTADSGTDITAAEAEELTDGSETLLHTHAGGGGGDTVAADNEAITGLWNFMNSGAGGLTDYDATYGDVATPDYGIIRIGNSILGRTSHTTGYNLNGALVMQNIGGPVTGDIEFAVLDSSNLMRFGLPKSGVGNATYSPRSMLIAGPAIADSDIVTVGYWQTQGIFHNIDCDTGVTGADLGVQNDLEVEGDIFADSIKESTTGAGVTIEGVPIDSGLVDGIDISVDVAANTAKVTNVTTNLSEGTSTTTAVDVNSSDGTNATLLAASTTRAGVLTKAKFDEIVVNNGKVTNADHGGTGDVHGSADLTIQVGVVDPAMMSASGTPSATTYLRGDNTWATVSGSGDVNKVGTPVNDQVGVWTGDGTLEGDADLTFDGLNLSVGGNLVVGGTVDGIDIATDVVANTTHRGQTDNPHSVDKADVVLENVTNDKQIRDVDGSFVGDFTGSSDPLTSTLIVTELQAGGKKQTNLGALPISTKTQTALDAKVTGPATSTDDSIARFNGTDQKVVQGSGVTIDDSDNVDIPGTLQLDGDMTYSGNVSQTALITDTGSGAAVAVDFTDGNKVKLTPTGNITSLDLTFPASTRVGSYTLLVSNPFDYTITWPSSFKWPGGVAPDVSGACLVGFFWDGTNAWATYSEDMS